MITIISFIALFVMLSSFILASLFIDDAKDESAKTITHWAELIANTNNIDLVSDEVALINNYLSMLKHVPSVRHVHIYKILPESESIDIFPTYNKNIDSFAFNKSDSVTELSSVKFSSHTIELIVPITQKGLKVGYVYIQTNNDYVQKTTEAMLFRLSIILFLLILIIVLAVLVLNHFITEPMAGMASKIQEISKQKKFDLRIAQMPFKELDIIARNINIMLSRTESQLTKLADAKQIASQHTKDLEDKVNKRTQALKDSNSELLLTLETLHQFQGQLVESEKMASLGDMVAGVAHEVNTPIGLGVTASTLLSDRLLEIKQAFDDKTLKSSHLKKFLIEGEENTAIIYRNLKRAAELIASFKKVAVDQSSEEVRSFNVKHLLDEVLLTLAPQIKNLPYEIHIDSPDELIITSKPGPINQIIINLIQNSITHGFDERDHGVINIKVSFAGEMLNIDYQDDGKGIQPSIIKKVFEPFTTTKRGSGGSGLGLHLVYNLVTQALGGKISFSSEVDSGVNFKITIPTQMIEDY